MAKFGIALGSGPRGRGFESRCSDHRKQYRKRLFCGTFSLFSGKYQIFLQICVFAIFPINLKK